MMKPKDWGLLGLMLYLIYVHSLWWTERHSLWGAWRQSWEQRAMAQWEAEKQALRLACEPRQIPERQKWTTPRWGMQPTPPASTVRQRLLASPPDWTTQSQWPRIVERLVELGVVPPD